MNEKIEKSQAAPRIALTPDGKVLIFDQNGKEINGKKRSLKEFIEDVNENDLVAYQPISLFSVKGSCRIWVIIPGMGWYYCFEVDCATGAYIGPCS